eukprot:2151314-Pyramimonas_sp.AAC.2
MAQGGMSQADIDETASMGLSGQDAQRLEAVSTACKVPDLLVLSASADVQSGCSEYMSGCCARRGGRDMVHGRASVQGQSDGKVR